MLGYAVALNLEGAPLSYQEASAKDPVVNAILGIWLMSNGIPLALTGIADRPDERI
jgi:hypothetical protein